MFTTPPDPAIQQIVIHLRQRKKRRKEGQHSAGKLDFGKRAPAADVSATPAPVRASNASGGGAADSFLARGRSRDSSLPLKTLDYCFCKSISARVFFPSGP